MLKREGEEGHIADIEKAHETALQMNPNASLAAEFRRRAQELAGDKDPHESDNPIVKQWLKMAAEQDQLAEQVGEKAEADYDQRKALILEKSQALITLVAESAVKMQRGEGERDEYYSIQPPIEEAQGLGVSEEYFTQEYRSFILQSLRVDPEAVAKAKDEFEAESERAYGLPKLIPTILPSTYLRVGRERFGEAKLAEKILVRAKQE